MGNTNGGFTMPGESGYERLTLETAQRWGADVIRDSDGTALSEEILNAGYGIYSTICIIRDHNDWASENRDKLQQSFLMTEPKVAEGNILELAVMKDFFAEQFQVNDTLEALEYWQVYDRTAGCEVENKAWKYDMESGKITIKEAVPWHKYTVSFLAYRIWEEISMYNHMTNHWDQEHLLQIDPRHPKAQVYLLDWLKNWCEGHPDTTVVRFTSMFYNFVWIWGSDIRNRHRFTDWASYDFTVSPLALNQFAKKYGYRLTAEDFIHQGKLHATHSPAPQSKLDYMEFIHDFVISFGRKLVDMVHEYGKKAYVFYDDSWVGIEPYSPRFREFGFDGLIKAVFSGFESRLCSGVEVETHELRLHPYLFPVGVDGSPSFLEDGDPALEAKKYWKGVRRAILRAPIERLGLGGYLHLVERKPDFVDYIQKLADEFREIKKLHNAGGPAVLKPKIAVLHFWGALRSWSCSGHFHETYMHTLIHINESLSGLPFDVSFIRFEDVKSGRLQEFDVIINAGSMGSAWSGGEAWKDVEVVEKLTEWVSRGGAFIGVEEPSAVPDYDTTFRMAHLLGVDVDLGERVCHGRWSFEVEEVQGLIPEGALIQEKASIYLTDGGARVLAARNGVPVLTDYGFGKGRGIYLASFETGAENTRMLQQLILYAADEVLQPDTVPDNVHTEAAYYPDSKALILINNSNEKQYAKVSVGGRQYEAEMEGYGSMIFQ